MSTIEAEQTTTDEKPDEPVQTDSSPAVAEQVREELFAWNAWVHVGEGSDSCALAEAVSNPDYRAGTKIPLCEDPGHFHAWLRLPNPLQRRDIVDKARAARARKARELRDPDSDTAVILEDDLEQIRDTEEWDVLIDEIVEKNYQEDLIEATQAVMDLEDDGAEADEDSGEIPMLYGTIDQDIEELRRQEALPEDERDSGFARLKEHVDAYRAAIEERIEIAQNRRREVLKESDHDQLLDMVRKDRREIICTEDYIHHYSVWLWYTCTYRPKAEGTPNQRVWSDVGQVRHDAAPEVISAVRTTFEAMDRNLLGTRKNF